MISRSILLAATAAACLAPLPAPAQQHQNMPGMTMPGSSMPGMDMHETKSTAPYHPGLGDLMTAFVQPRHTKLGLAGAAGNWDYAAYELDELRESFDDAGKLILKHGELVIAPAIAATVSQPLDALDKAIAAKDSAGFAKAYADLTTACNACHQSAGHAAIVIQVPTVSGTAFPDQDFSPPKK
jgi:hypothetical protein